MFRRGVIALLVILFPTAFAAAQEFKSVRMGYPSLGFRQGHIWVADYIIPNVVQRREASTVIRKRLFQWGVGILAKVHANRDVARRYLETVCYGRGAIVVEPHAVDHRFICW